MILWLNPVSGVSGDMLLGALIDLGAPIDAIRDSITSTGLTGWQLTTSREQRHGITGCHAHVAVTDTATERRAAELIDLVSRASPAPVAELATRAVQAIAAVEGELHGVAADQVHLHEVGGHDTVVDTVGVAAALHYLGVDSSYSAPLRTGSGTTGSRHGTLPVPAPATLRLMAGMRVQVVDSQLELVTPTGAGLLKAARTSFDTVPEMTVTASGYGIGTRDTADRPNLLPAVLGTPVPQQDGAVVMIETTVDDASGEVLAHACAQVLAAGAVDVWMTPVLGKKGRPAQVISVLSGEHQVTELETILLRETGSLGARRWRLDRTVLPRSERSIELHGMPVRLKQGPFRSKAEYDDLAAIAADTGRSVRELAEAAIVEAAQDETSG
jgi:uncharacterized protein (TIGR00299 family) protein